MLTNLVAQLSRAALAAVLASRPRVHVGGDPSVNQTCRVLILGSQTVKSNSATENVSGYSSQKTTGLFQSVREIATAKGARFSSLCMPECHLQSDNPDSGIRETAGVFRFQNNCRIVDCGLQGPRGLSPLSRRGDNPRAVFQSESESENIRSRS